MEGHTAAADAWPPSVINGPADRQASPRNRPCYNNTAAQAWPSHWSSHTAQNRSMHRQGTTPASQHSKQPTHLQTRGSAAFKTMPHDSLHSMQSLTAGSKASIMCSAGAACPASTTTAKGPSAGQESGTGHAHILSLTLDCGPQPTSGLLSNHKQQRRPVGGPFPSLPPCTGIHTRLQLKPGHEHQHVGYTSLSESCSNQPLQASMGRQQTQPEHAGGRGARRALTCRHLCKSRFNMGAHAHSAH